MRPAQGPSPRILYFVLICPLPALASAGYSHILSSPLETDTSTTTTAISTGGRKRRQLENPIESLIDCSNYEDPNAYFVSSVYAGRSFPCWYLKAAQLDSECSPKNSLEEDITVADLVCPWSCGKCPLEIPPATNIEVAQTQDDDWDDHHGNDDWIWDDGFEDEEEEEEITEVEPNAEIDGGGMKGMPESTTVNRVEDEPLITDEDVPLITEDSTVPDDGRPIHPISVDSQKPGSTSSAVSCNRAGGCGGNTSSNAGFGILPRQSRRWDAVISHQDIVIEDPTGGKYFVAMERDPMYFTGSPSARPSVSPTPGPTGSPTLSPTPAPSASPTPGPTGTPTSSPTSRPTGSPTASPTASPTETLFVTEPEPNFYTPSYFNYNPYSPRGVNNWSAVTQTKESEYWKKDFDKFISIDLNQNLCGSRGRRQSPIDVSFAKSKGQCFEYHMIRPKPGEYSIEDPVVEKQILPSKLRFVYPRGYTDARVGSDEEWATKNDAIIGPSADVPKGWGHQLPVTHVDVKVPSEHTMEGKRYAAEYQIFLIQNHEKKQRGSPAVSILVDLHPEDEKNWRFDIMLKAFEEVYDANAAKCEAKMRKQRKLGALFDIMGALSNPDRSTWLDEPEEEEIKFQHYLRATERKAQEYRKFNPFSSDIMRSIWFFGYEGSLTEPPCSEFVEWRVVDTPALISQKQLLRLKKLLFHNVNENCQRTSVHYDGSVARPAQPYAGRLVHRCMCHDFINDQLREEYGQNRCKWVDREFFGFSRDQYSKEWYERTHMYDNPTQQPLFDPDWTSF